MLLGVDDFETLDAYHRGKQWLHNAWLHRAGAVWGLDVSLDEERGELRVEPGLALDGLGRELYLPTPVCLSLGRWFAEHQEDPDLEATTLDNGRIRFDAHVVMRFRGCLTRQVPALVEPCEGSATTTAYSRVAETAELLLLPGLARETELPPFHRLRLLFGLEEPREEEGTIVDADQEVLDARNAIAVLPAGEQAAAWLAALRRFAALDTIDLRPAVTPNGEETTLFPGGATVPLANITEITLESVNGSWRLVAEGPARIDTSIRPAHVATTTIQELLCGGSAADAGGPRVDPESVTVDGTQLRLQVSAPLAPASVTPGAFGVTVFDAGAGWSSVTIEDASFDETSNTITLELEAEPGVGLLRLVARGTGATPLLGSDGVPLAGSLADPPGSTHDGHDFIIMQERS
ncbi:hypothetical protein NB231_06421 [Nitrococcus mobilis Nb-231]|uniref:Uncharacterized protein n=2 Tax=Nitrococcus mobilis TaxID=35797 RepID=A4BR01_9GAMM|nr:hypothetical protein NB231_06421 [Nitrococcus mobilis Nb-231]